MIALMHLIAEPVGDNDGIGQRFVRELDALSLGTLANTLLLALAMIVLASFASWGLALLAARARRVFGSLRGAVDRLTARLQLVVALAAGTVALWPILVRAPLVVASIALALALVVAFVAPGVAQDFVAGLTLARRRVFGEGDTIEVGDVGGRVIDIGTWRTTLESTDGARVFVPNREITRGMVRVAAVAGASRIRAVVERDQVPSAQWLERTRQHALRSPFRLPGGVVLVENDGKRVRIELETWSGAAAPTLARRIAQAARTRPERDPTEADA